jgi:thiosulfate/3-mercaptopyruvate sulfurtransferase
MTGIIKPMPTLPLLITPEELYLLLQNRTPLCVLDATTFRPDEPFNAETAFQEGHIPGAYRFSIDDVSDDQTDLPHMVPAADVFHAYVRARGVTPDLPVVVYDQQGLFSAPRAWWMFRLFGYKQVSVLNGGMPAWREAGLPIEQGPETRIVPTYTPAEGLTWPMEGERLANRFDVQLAGGDHAITLVDARPVARFQGAAPEPRAGLRQGHIPGSVNLPHTHLLEQNRLIMDKARLQHVIETGTGVSVEALKQGHTSIISSCGSGITACVLPLALEYLGIPPSVVAVYDGSWAEWGSYSEAELQMQP